MTKRTSKEKPVTRARDRAAVHRPTRAESHKSAQRKAEAESLKEDMSDLLDDIDEVLEENAEEFIKNYRQLNGE